MVFGFVCIHLPVCCEGDYPGTLLCSCYLQCSSEFLAGPRLEYKSKSKSKSFFCF
jgi:hypothetical protein